MPLDPSQIDLIAFDYGNTLIPFGPEQSRVLGASLHADLERLFGPADPVQIERLSHAARNAPFVGESPTLKEHDFEVLLGEIVAELYGDAPEPERLRALRQARHDSFLAVCAVEASVHETLARLRTRYRLALLSNYPDGPAIRSSLVRTGLDVHFEHIVVSGELGYVKPHPVTFAQLIAPFGIATRRAVYVGDNWLADIQGAKRIGMGAIHITRWDSIDEIPVNEADHRPDHTIAHLSELEAIFLA